MSIIYAGAVSHPYTHKHKHIYFSHIAMHSLALMLRTAQQNVGLKRQRACREICEWAHCTVRMQLALSSSSKGDRYIQFMYSTVWCSMVWCCYFIFLCVNTLTLVLFYIKSVAAPSRSHTLSICMVFAAFFKLSFRLGVIFLLFLPFAHTVTQTFRFLFFSIQS